MANAKQVRYSICDLKTPKKCEMKDGVLILCSEIYSSSVDNIEFLLAHENTKDIALANATFIFVAAVKRNNMLVMERVREFFCANLNELVLKKCLSAACTIARGRMLNWLLQFKVDTDMAIYDATLKNNLERLSMLLSNRNSRVHISKISEGIRRSEYDCNKCTLLLNNKIAATNAFISHILDRLKLKRIAPSISRMIV